MIIILDVTNEGRTKLVFTKDGEIMSQAGTTKKKGSSAFFLTTFDSQMKKMKAKPTEINGIYVAEGKGSFTTTRIAAVFANTLGFSLNIPVTGAQYPAPFTEKQIKDAESALATKRDFRESYAPQYSHAPNITTPKAVC